MLPRTPSEGSDPVLEVCATGTATTDGDYLQHEAVAPHKPHSAEVDAMTVVIRNDTVPPVAMLADGDAAAPAADGLEDFASLPEEVTSVTKANLRGKGWGLFRLFAFVETHRLTTMMFVVGGLFILLAALLAGR